MIFLGWLAILGLTIACYCLGWQARDIKADRDEARAWEARYNRRLNDYNEGEQP